MPAVSCFVHPGMEQYTQDLPDVYYRYIGRDTILGHGDQRVHGVPGYKAVLEFPCMYTTDKHHHHTDDISDNLKCDCVSNRIGFVHVSMAGV